MNEIAMGIDLGTSYCCVSIIRNGRCEIIQSANGKSTTPSYVTIDAEGTYVGEASKSKSVEDPKNTVFGIKRIMGKRFEDGEVQLYKDRWPFKLVNQAGAPVVEISTNNTTKTHSPGCISAFVLSHLRTLVSTYLNKDVVKAVIAVPANFTESQRRATWEAGTNAGLQVIGMINEPTAAALSYALDRSQVDQKLLVFDFGGGTLDVAILQASSGKPLQVLATAADMNLGGEDFDEKLLCKFADEFSETIDTNLRENHVALARLRLQCDVVKRCLSGTQPSVRVAIPCLVDDKHFITNIKREDFENLCDDLFDRILDPVKSALRFASLNAGDINQVVLVGGSSRIPKVQKILQNFFPGITLSKDINADEAISRGAAIYAQTKLIDPRAAVQAPQLFRDIVPYSIGIESVTKEMVVVIRRGSEIPAKGIQRCTTTYRNQDCVRVKVYEGENKLANKNNVLGELVLSGIAPDEAEVPVILVELCFDMFGCLRVSAVEKRSGVTSGTTLKCSILPL